LCIFDEMTKLTKTLASASVAGFVAGGIIDFGGFNVASALLLVLPLGAVFLGLTLIAFMLEKEMAKFDAEEASKRQSIQRQPAATAVKKKFSRNASLQLLHDS